MIPRTPIPSLIAKFPKNQLLSTLSFPSSPIPASLRRKDWLSPAEAHRAFESLADPSTLLPALTHYAARKDYTPTEPLFSLILARLARADLPRHARAVFSRATTDPPLFTLSDAFFRRAIGACGADRAAEILLDMPGKFGAWPSSETFATALDVLVSAGMFEDARRVFAAVRRLGVGIDSRCLNVVMRGLCEIGDLDGAFKVFDEFPRLKCEPDLGTYVMLMRYFCADGRVNEALRLFKRMNDEARIEPDTTTFHVLIVGLVRHQRVDDGLALLQRMIVEGFEPNGESYRAVFSGFIASERFLEAKEVIKEAVKWGVNPSFRSYKRLIFGLCRENLIEDVERVLEEMKKLGFVPNTEVWREILEVLFAGKNDLDFESVCCEEIRTC